MSWSNRDVFTGGFQTDPCPEHVTHLGIHLCGTISGTRSSVAGAGRARVDAYHSFVPVMPGISTMPLHSTVAPSTL